MKTISIALVSTFLVSNVSAFVPAQPSMAFRTPSVFASAVNEKQQRLLTRVAMSKNVMERTDTEEENKIALAAPESGELREEEITETRTLMQKVKDAGTAGIISYMLWEFAFWGASVPVVLSAYYGVTGHFPDLSNQDDLAKLGAEAFAFVNVARFAVPLRIGLALSTTPWIKDNFVDRFFKKKDEKEADEGVESYDPAEKMRKL